MDKKETLEKLERHFIMDRKETSEKLEEVNKQLVKHRSELEKHVLRAKRATLLGFYRDAEWELDEAIVIIQKMNDERSMR